MDISAGVLALIGFLAATLPSPSMVTFVGPGTGSETSSKPNGK